MKIISTILIALLIFGCNTKTEKNKNNSSIQLEKENQNEKQTEFKFSDYQIKKGKLGPIEIGMNIMDAENQFNGLSKKKDEAINFGFGGGSPAYLYYSNDEIIFGLIPKLGTDEILSIIAVHPELKTMNGLNPKSTVNQLLEKYPDMLINKSLMNDWEFSNDNAMNWTFVFMADEKNQIGVYPDIDNPSEPKKLTTKSDWLTIE
ncbi:hypothetical protein [Psychroflexus sediminis]|uniref:Lipoprotein n=1 Tax=Psychroflexus sediminis TaxID=470826 RepID=A0A1G7VZB2_9FLAO|nr:hypothetical protein [Psychroflexus sediminis]SDG65043.1 hypothetical protein SAMN04488027_104273 [Psychroflexus sediminis]